jgi:hypothetical protein
LLGSPLKSLVDQLDHFFIRRWTPLPCAALLALALGLGDTGEPATPPRGGSSQHPLKPYSTGVSLVNENRKSVALPISLSFPRARARFC